MSKTPIYNVREWKAARNRLFLEAADAGFSEADAMAYADETMELTCVWAQTTRSGRRYSPPTFAAA